MKTQKEKLIELLSEHHSGNHQEAERIAEYLMENGVVVFPSKVGDTVFRITPTKAISEYVVMTAQQSMSGEFLLQLVNRFDDYWAWERDFGNELFLTREQATESRNRRVSE